MAPHAPLLGTSMAVPSELFTCSAEAPPFAPSDVLRRAHSRDISLHAQAGISLQHVGDGPVTEFVRAWNLYAPRACMNSQGRQPQSV